MFQKAIQHLLGVYRQKETDGDCSIVERFICGALRINLAEQEIYIPRELVCNLRFQVLEVLCKITNS